MAKTTTESTESETYSYVETLKCVLTDKEVQDRAQLLAQHVDEVNTKESELKAETSHRKAIIQQIESKVNEIAAEIRNRATYRRIDCERIKDFRLGTCREVRLDTGEILNTRPLNYDERQRVLPLSPPVQAAAVHVAQIIQEIDEAGARIVEENEAKPTVETVTPARRVGRPKGTKNKRKAETKPEPAPKRGRTPKRRAGVKSPAEALSELA
jgi:hypothetical protein